MKVCFIVAVFQTANGFYAVVVWIIRPPAPGCSGAGTPPLFVCMIAHKGLFCNPKNIGRSVVFA